MQLACNSCGPAVDDSKSWGEENGLLQQTSLRKRRTNVGDDESGEVRNASCESGQYGRMAARGFASQCTLAVATVGWRSEAIKVIIKVIRA